MNNKHSKLDISGALAAAACTLLGNGAHAGLLDYDLGGDQWDAEAALMYYGESDGRVSAVSPVLQFTRNVDTDEFQTFRLTVDTLTGASPSGAVPSNQPQTFTGPSGNNDYTIAAGEATLDSSFRDTRVALNAGWERPVGESYIMSLGANVSNEYDYFSLGFNGRLAREFNQNNTTLSAGISLANDTISAVGGTPLAFAAIPVARGRDRDDTSNDDSVSVKLSGDENKTVTDLLFGVTQVIDRDSVVQVSLGFSHSAGYQNDPYKIISVVDDTGNPVVADQTNNLSLALYENRPDSRTRQSLYLQYNAILMDRCSILLIAICRTTGKCNRTRSM